MRFLGRWLAQALRLSLSLGMALGAMQLPPLARQYAAGLQQVAESGRRDIDQRKVAARQFYPATGDSDEAVITALGKVEPSNAQALRVSVSRVQAVAQAQARIAQTTPLLRPVVAAADAAGDATGEKRVVLQTTLATYAPQIELAGEALSYALAGLLLGSFLAEALIALGRAAAGDERRRVRLAGGGR